MSGFRIWLCWEAGVCLGSDTAHCQSTQGEQVQHKRVWQLLGTPGSVYSL